MSKGWQVLTGLLAFIVVFSAGTIFGGALSLRFGLAEHFPGLEHRGKAPTGTGHEFSFQKLRSWIKSDQLKLTPEQNQQIKPILAAAAKDYQRLMNDDTRGGFLIIEHMEDEVEPLLTPEQRAKFDALRERQREQVLEWQRQRSHQWQQQWNQPLPPSPGGQPQP